MESTAEQTRTRIDEAGHRPRLTKPQMPPVPTVYVSFTSKDGKRCRGLTVYNATPDEARDLVRKALEVGGQDGADRKLDPESPDGD